MNKEIETYNSSNDNADDRIARMEESMIKSKGIRTDFENVPPLTTLFLHPNDCNPIHQERIACFYDGKYFFGAGTDPIEGPDYYLGDVLRYNYGFTLGDS